jgi:hypothetical protein
MITFKDIGTGAVIQYLNHAADKVADSARKSMHRSADRIVKRAQLFAPVDEHNLEESIRKQVTYETRGRLKIDVVAGGFINGVDVDEYAARIHEAYPEDRPGKGTQDKRDANPGVHIGGKFLERAAKEEEKKLTQAMIASIQSEIPKS